MADKAPLLFDTRLGGLPSPSVMRSLLEYDPTTGKLFWKARPASMFSESRGKIVRAKEWSAAKWNTRYAGKEALTKSHRGGYLWGSVLDRACLAHRAAWAVYWGAWPEGSIDHINGDPRDNRISNLRDVTHGENMRNTKRHRTNTSGQAGVYWAEHVEKWAAEIWVSGKKKHLGLFGEQADAVTARKQAEAEHGYHPNHGRAGRA